MKTGPGSRARSLAYAIDALIIARFAHFYARPQDVDDKKAKVDSKVELLEQAIAKLEDE